MKEEVGEAAINSFYHKDINQTVDLRFGQAVGADAYLTKPIDSNILLDKMKELLEKRK